MHQGNQYLHWSDYLNKLAIMYSVSIHITLKAASQHNKHISNAQGEGPTRLLPEAMHDSAIIITYGRFVSFQFDFNKIIT